MELFTCMPLWKINQTRKPLKSCFAPLYPTSSSTIPVWHSVSVPFVLWRLRDLTRGSHVEKCHFYPWVHRPSRGGRARAALRGVPPRRGSPRHLGTSTLLFFFFLFFLYLTFLFFSFLFLSIFFLFVFHVAGSAVSWFLLFSIFVIVLISLFSFSFIFLFLFIFLFCFKWLLLLLLLLF